MPPISSIKSWKPLVLGSIGLTICWLVYAALSLLAPQVSGARYSLTSTESMWLKLTIIVPLYLIWLIAIRGAMRFKRYASLIKAGTEAAAISQIATGLILTVVYLVATSLVGAIVPLLYGSPYLDDALIIRDHLPPLLSLAAFFTLYRGSHRLRLIGHFTTWDQTTTWVAAAFGLLSIAFVFIFATSPSPLAALVNRNSISILPRSLLLFTLILPYLAAWFMGVLACINIIKFSRAVKGIIYRQALQNLVFGISAIVFLAVTLQVLSLLTRFMSNLRLAPILLVTYGLLLLYGLGFLFVRSGAKKLTRIEGLQ